MWLSVGDLRGKVVDTSQETITNAALAAGMQVVPAGTLMMSFKLSLGKVAFAGTDLYTNEAICHLRHLAVDPDYLYYALQRVEFRDYGRQAVKGYTLNSESLANICFPLPPLPEQRAIAAVLTDVDDLIGSLEALVAKKRSIKKAAMQELLTGRTRLPGFGGEWERISIGRIGDSYGGLAGKTNDDFGTGSAHYVSFLNVLDNVRVTDRRRFDRVRIGQSESQHRVRRDDVLFNATSETPEDLAMGAVLAVDSADLYLNSFCFGLRIHDRRRCDPLFLAYLSRGEPGRAATRALAQGATRYNLSKRRFLNLRIPLPPLPEQRAIAAILTDMDAEITALERRLDKTRAIKQGMMQQLLTGSVRLPIPTDGTGDNDNGA